MGTREVSSTNKSIIASLKKLTILKGGNNATNYNTNEKDIQVDLVEIIYHSIVSINSTNHEFLDPNDQLGRYLGRLKFDVLS